MKHEIDVSSDSFGAVLNCAVRYALGRYTYMPTLVMNEIRPLLPHLSRKTLAVMQWDIGAAAQKEGGLGDRVIDEPEWLRFLEDVKRVLEAPSVSLTADSSLLRKEPLGEGLRLTAPSLKRRSLYGRGCA